MKLRIERANDKRINDRINGDPQSGIKEYEVSINDKIYKEFHRINEPLKSEDSTSPSLLLSTEDSSPEPEPPPTTPTLSFSEVESTSSLTEDALQSPVNELSKVGKVSEDHTHIIRSYQFNKYNRFKILGYLSNE